MPGRIITAQRQLAEIGRLRSGYTGAKGPVRSKTWIITGAEPDVMDAAAIEWGGKVEKWTPLNGKNVELKLVTDTDRLPAWLPPGDPLTQANEMWSRGGVVRRCDGVKESKSGKPCVCLAEYGEEWYRRKPTEVCRPHSYLSLLLLQLPDVGAFRHTTKSFYAAGEIATQVDFIKARVGLDLTVPVWLIIDQREKVADGKTTPYPVPRIRIRGAESAMEMLAGNVPTLALEVSERRQAIGAGPDQPALSAGPAEPERLTAAKVAQLAAIAKNLPQVQQLWRDAAQDEVLDDGVKALLNARATELGATPKPATAPAVTAVAEAVPAGDEPVDADDTDEPDRDGTWMQINAAAGKKKWSAEKLENHVIEMFGKSSLDINGWQMEQFLTAVTTGAIQ